MGEIFSNSREDDVSKGDKLAIICERLNMDEEQLARLQKNNGTKTARSIVRAYDPVGTRVDVSHEDVAADVRHSIHGIGFSLCSIGVERLSLLSDYVQMYHALESLSEGKINESINNVFRSAKSQEKGKKDKHESPPNQAA